MKLLRKIVARYRLTHARFDVAYWQSAMDIAGEQYADACKRVARLEQVPNEVDFPLPKVIRTRRGT